MLLDAGFHFNKMMSKAHWVTLKSKSLTYNFVLKFYKDIVLQSHNGFSYKATMDSVDTNTWSDGR